MSKKEIYKAYKFCLGGGIIDNTNYFNKIKVYVGDIIREPKLTNDLNNINLRYTSNYIKTELNMNFANITLAPNVESCDNDYNSESITYQGILNQPCSACIFDENNYQNSWIKSNSTFNMWKQASNDETKEKMKSLLNDQFIFNKEYDLEEYYGYDIPLDYLIGNISRLNFEDGSIMNSKKNQPMLQGKAMLITYDNTNEDKIIEIPMMYIEFDKSFYGTKIAIDWHSNGLMEVK